jgi:cytochrome P450
MSLPAGPNTPPIVQLIQWIFNPLDYLETNAQRYGDMFHARLGSRFHPVFVNHPQGVRDILTVDAKQFDAGRTNGILQSLVGEHSILLLDGDRHQRQRKLLMPPFHGERMRAYGRLICQLTQQVADTWQIDRPFAVRPAMQEITMRVILQAVFGLNEGSRYRKLQQLLGQLLDMTGSPLKSSFLFFPALQKDLGAWSPWGRIVRQHQQVDDLIYAEIRERRENSDRDREDILTLLLSARDEQGEGMSDVELHDELMTLLVAGHETTATALSWALYWIHSIPSVREQLLAELDDLGTDADPGAIAKLPYLDAVCQETLRIYPVAMITFPRIATSPVRVMDRQFDPETLFAPCIYLLHHREDIYPNPKQFRPERFLERQYSPYEFLPFGGGNRRCIGMALAQYEMKLAIATIVSQLRLELATSQPVKPMRRGITLAPSANLKLVARDRRQAPLSQPATASDRSA